MRLRIVVAVSMRPGDFSHGDATDESGRWEIGGQVFTRNPAKLIGPDERDMMHMWAAWRTGGFGGGSVLPEAYQDQPAVMLDAFRIMSQQYDEVQALLKRQSPP